MRHLLSATLLASTLLGSGSAYAQACSIGSREGLLNYMQEFASGFPNFTRAVASGTNTLANQRLAEYRQMIANCQTTIQLTGMSACMATATRLAEMNARRVAISGSSSQGMEMSDRAYQDQLPDVLKTLPADLQNGLPSDWREVARRNGWQAVSYRSRTVGNPGPARSYMRVLFKIPGNPYETWFQFTVGELDNPTQPEQLVDAIAVNTQTKEISFNQFWRNSSGQNPRPRLEGPHGSSPNMDRCITCHPNGMREISPAPGSYTAQDAPVIDQMNAAMQGYKRLSWRGLDVDAYGPPLGQTEGCVRCHNGYSGDPAISRGALTVMTSDANFQHKLLDDMSMSPTTFTDRDEALQYVKNIPLVLSEAERQRMMNEVYGGSMGSNFNKTLQTLSWMRDNAGLSSADYLRYAGALQEFRTENEPIAAGTTGLRAGMAGEDETREWLLQDCDIPVARALPPPSVIDADGSDEPDAGASTTGGTSASPR